MQIRWKSLAALILMGVPLNAQTSKPRYLSDWDHMCKATLADGTKYEVWDRLLVTEWQGKPSYLPVRGLYRPGSGEFLLRAGLGFVDKEHAIAMMEKPPKGGPCPEDSQYHVLLLQDGQWIDFWSRNGSVEVFHSNLKFRARKEAWSYVAEHWQAADSFGGVSTKFVEVINPYQQLGADFSRPKRLEFSAQGYLYNSLGSVKKVGQNWELEIRGAEEPNRATVLLDSDFKLLAVTKNHGTP
ncbi:MAG TPA: hypothetical protein VN087_10765 [Verrucomicrobiae bacterium]|jgi:hypothetical protein|nr:hypothetical protein [Verrucomicrobiae bacterium]